MENNWGDRILNGSRPASNDSSSGEDEQVKVQSEEDERFEINSTGEGEI